MNKRYLRKKKKREKKKQRSKRRPPRREKVRLPEVDESILKKMEPLNPPEVVSLDLAGVVKAKPKSKGFNKDMFMREDSKPKKVEQEPEAGFDRGSWIKNG